LFSLSVYATAHAATPPQTAAVSPVSLKTANAPATPEFGAPQLIAIILEHNTPLLAAQSARIAAQLGVKSAQALPNPRFDLNQGRNTARIAGVTPGPMQVWSVTQAIENPSSRKARIDVATATEQESGHLLRLTRNALVSEARLRIYQALLHQALVEAGAEDVQLLEQVRERVSLRVASGEAARYEIIKAGMSSNTKPWSILVDCGITTSQCSRWFRPLQPTIPMPAAVFCRKSMSNT
jgi:cobalt-zinc-cadmium efflux system outer membrane protein